MRVRRGIITIEHSGGAPTEPLAVEAVGHMNVGCVCGIEIARIVEKIGWFAAAAANGIADERTASLIIGDLRREGDCGYGSSQC